MAALICIACRRRRVPPATCPSCGCVSRHALGRRDLCIDTLKAEDLERVEATWVREQFCECFLPDREINRHTYLCGCVRETIKDWAQICQPHMLQIQANRQSGTPAVTDAHIN